MFLNPHEVMRACIPKILCPCTLLGNPPLVYTRLDWLHLYLKKKERRENKYEKSLYRRAG